MMKNKLNKFLKSIIVSVAFVFGISLFAVNGITTKSYAATVGDWHLSSQKLVQNEAVANILNVSQISGSKVIYLYPNNNGITSIKDCFSYYNSDDSDDTESTDTELVHNEKETFSPSEVLPHNGQFSSVITLDNNIMLALYSGNISVSAQAQTGSWKNGTSWAVWNDSEDYVKTSLFVYSALDSSNYASTATAETAKADYSLDSLSISQDNLKNLLYNRIELVFQSKLNGVVRNYLKVKEPVVTINSLDSVAPTISGFDKVSTAWAQSRDVELVFEDSASGIHKIEMQTNGGEWVEVANFADVETPTYTTAYTYKFTINENNSAYKFRVTDNVGNVNEMAEAFVEERIDTVKPNATISIADTFGCKQIDFSASIVPSTLSNDTFTYTLKNSMGDAVASGSLAEANSVLVDTDGEYTLEVAGVDEAGNTFAWSGSTSVQRIIVSMTIESNYIYNLNGFELDYSANVEGEYETVWTYLVAGESATIENIENIGTYVVTYSIDAFEFVGSGSQTIMVAPKLVEIGSITTSYVYGEAFKYTLLDQQDANADIVVNFTLNGEPATFENVGTYAFEFVAQNTNYQLAETKGEATIAPQVVTATIEDSVQAYDGNPHLLRISYSADLNFIVKYSLGGVDVEQPTKAGAYEVVISLKEENPNYSFEQVVTTFTISQAKLYVIASEMQSKVYGNTDPVFAYTIYGLLDGDVIEGSLSREQGEDVGYYNITIGSLNAENYEIEFTSSVFEIQKKSLILLALDSQKVYGEQDPKLAYNKSVANILDADNAAFLADGVMVRTAGENVGKYEVSFNAELLNVAPFKNYKILSTTANFKIVKANLEIVADNIVATYGNEESLTFKTTGLVAGDELDITLSRESGKVVGSYQISLQNGKFDNYNVSFVGATYTIVAREIEVVANNVTKTYGQGEVLTYTVVGALDENVLTLSRVAGENVGTYEINSYTLNNSNYVVSKFTSAVLTIEKAEISVVVADASKFYGEADPEFDYEISGLKFDDRITLEFVRERGENVGEYEISLAENALDNYEISSVEVATLSIHKADPIIVIEDQSFVYSATAISYQANIGFELSYTYYFAGTEINAPVNAGEYTVVAHFAGNENYNSADSNEAKVIINKKFIPITLKKLDFLYNGKGQVPEYEIGLDTNVSVITIFENVKMPVEVGEYKFSMVSNDPNYYSSTTGVLRIVDVLYVEDTSNSVSLSSTAVSATNASIQILNNTSSSLLKKFNPLFDGRKCMAVYEFANAGAKTNGEVFTVRIKALDTDNPVEIYAVSSNGEMVNTAYTLVDGYYVFSLNSLSNQIMVTTTNNMMFYARIIAIVTVLFASVIITKATNRRRRNHFLKRNTTIKKFSKEELRQNIDIVNDHVDLVDRISPDSFIRIKK